MRINLGATCFAWRFPLFLDPDSTMPTPTSADFPAGSGWVKRILSKETWLPLLRE